MESSSWSFTYSAVRPTSSDSWRCFSTRRFLNCATRSFRIELSPPTPRRGEFPYASTQRERAQDARAPTMSHAVDRNGRRVAPEPLERVVCARVGEKDVHEDVAVVEQHPAALGLTLGVERTHTVLLQLVADRVGDRLDVWGGAAAANEEVVRDGRHALHVEHRQVHRLLVERRARGPARLVFRGRPR